MNKQTYRAVAWLLLIVATTAGYAQSGVKYPYVLNGKIIVSRDARGGAKTEALHENWTTTPGHEYAEQENRVAWKFEVADIDATLTTDVVCLSGWRRPTQRELLLMYAVRNQLTYSPFVKSGNKYLVSATSDNSTIFCYDVYNTTFNYFPITDIGTVRLRCIRDLD